MIAPEKGGIIQDQKLVENAPLKNDCLGKGLPQKKMEWKITAPEKGGILQHRKMAENAQLKMIASENDCPGKRQNGK